MKRKSPRVTTHFYKLEECRSLILRDVKSLELKIPPLAWFALTAVLMWACARCLPSWSFDFPGRSVLAATFALEGLALAFWGIRDFRRARTTVNPLQPKQASQLVTQGIYRFTRNPMYVGLALLALSGVFYFGNVLCLVFVANLVTCLHFFQILPEERILEDLFPEEYPAYKARVPRWLFQR